MRKGRKSIKCKRKARRPFGVREIRTTRATLICSSVHSCQVLGFRALDNLTCWSPGAAEKLPKLSNCSIEILRPPSLGKYGREREAVDE